MSDKAWYEKLIDGVASIAPTVANLIVPGSGLVLDGLMRAVTGDETSDIEAVAARIGGDPKLKAELLKMSMQREVSLAQEETKRIALQYDAQFKELQAGVDQISQVNSTMQSELDVAKATGNKHASLWRPVWGYCSAAAFFIACMGIIFLAGWAIKKGDAAMLGQIPLLIGALTSLFAVPGAILGVTAWHRGKMQRSVAGEPPAPEGVLKTLAAGVASRIGGKD